ncbi:oxysterol binding, putative [Ichthyophthirius multifiliis]|uniref:Oxysterol binding, putative n=1 Tax=Ichthyophthirius multifiliis TaxID=5932 RepID=G0R3K1_ICHMU|nr:oxysterol binding, putative [Ichthyophthirius multifiliis]EGR27990.1 oxysterol binding, putative [Ichthyophthirius multifiliis]|eukprot:XP_004027335.1 oxysterol binding, putative [Ichthyophthirius multifiliis]
MAQNTFYGNYSKINDNGNNKETPLKKSMFYRDSPKSLVDQTSTNTKILTQTENTNNMKLIAVNDNMRFGLPLYTGEIPLYAIKNIDEDLNNIQEWHWPIINDNPQSDETILQKKGEAFRQIKIAIKSIGIGIYDFNENTRLKCFQCDSSQAFQIHQVGFYLCKYAYSAILNKKLKQSPNWGIAYQFNTIKKLDQRVVVNNVAHNHQNWTYFLENQKWDLFKLYAKQIHYNRTAESEEYINQLSMENESLDKLCGVCKENICLDLQYTLQCGHVYHKICLSLLPQVFAALKCPLCENQNIKDNSAFMVNQIDESSYKDDLDQQLIGQVIENLPEYLDKVEYNDIFTQSMVAGLKQKKEEIKKIAQKSKYANKDNKTCENEQEIQKVDEEEVHIKKTQEDEQQKETPQEKQQQEVEIQIKNEEEIILENITEESNQNILQEDENVIYTLVKQEFQYHKKNISKQQIESYIKQFKPIQANDECRADCSYKEGGKECKDKKIKQCLRNIGKEIIKQIGNKIISGSFNLTQISFPIRAMIPQSALEKALYATCLFPIYINLAAQTNDLVERFKLLICATLGNFYINCGFLKPLNPILGETCQGMYPDGTKMYSEQISHHPPISYFVVYGPGTRHIKFKDGQFISYNFAKEIYGGSFMGTMKVESKGTITFQDVKNNIKAEISIDSVKKKPSDYICGEIKVNDQTVSKCYGSYMGFIEFDGMRYWDFRYVTPYKPIIIKSQLLSDQNHRIDKQYLQKGEIENAQKFKEQLENLQRNDAKLRSKFEQQTKKNKK